jgi:pSer/pThr/pTyr-binding forkhead associated (FHA) protein
LVEGSTNGTFLGRRRLAPHTPEPLRSGDRIRIGRVWLAIRVAPALVQGAPAAAARELALALVARGLAAQGEDASPRVVVIEGPDEGRALRLEEAGRPYVIGRAKDADLPLADQAAARRHAVVTRRGDHFLVRDLGAPGGAWLDGAPLSQADVPWRPSQILALGGTRLVCEHPAADALAELERCPDEPVRPGEALDPPGGADAGAETGTGAAAGAGAGTVAATGAGTGAGAGAGTGAGAATGTGAGADAGAATGAATGADAATGAGASAGAGEDAPLRREPSSGWGLTDAAVVLVALGVLGISIAGLVWLLGRG